MQADATCHEWFPQCHCLNSSLGLLELTHLYPASLPPPQRHKCNVPHFSPEEYYRRAIVLPFVDHLMQETSTRFGPLQQKTVALFALVPRQQLENVNAARTTQQHATS